MGLFSRKNKAGISKDIAERLEQKGFESGTLLCILANIDKALMDVAEGKEDIIVPIMLPFEDDAKNNALQYHIEGINNSLSILAESSNAIKEHWNDKVRKDLDILKHGD